MKKSVEFNSGGQKIYGAFYQAESPVPLPTVLMLGGFPPGGGDSSIGQDLAQHGIHTMTFNYRGTLKSEGTASLANAQDDIQAAFTYLRKEEVARQYNVDTGKLILVGVSFGGGMALIYGANHHEIERIISIAGDDYGEFAREYKRNPAFAERIDAALEAAKSLPEPVRYEGEGIMDELLENPDPYDLRLKAAALANRDILLIGGWDDLTVNIEDRILPFYRALREAKAQSVQIVAFQDDHSFEKSGEEMVALIAQWINSPVTL